MSVLVSIPERVLEALKLSFLTYIACVCIPVSIPERVLEALKQHLENFILASR